MTVASPCRRLFAAIVPLCLVLVTATEVAPAQGAPATRLRLDPATAHVGSGETLTLTLWVDDVVDLYRAEIHLNYDWPALIVQDADPGRVSVQIAPGPIFCASCTPWNEAVDGDIHFVAQREPTSGSFSGSGVAATITIRVSADEPGTYTVSCDQAATRLLDSNDLPIPVTQFTDATIAPPPIVTLTGWLTRQGWGDDERSVVNAVLYPANPPFDPVSWGRTCTDEDGDFVLTLSHTAQPPPASILPVDSPPSSSPCTAQWAFVRLNFTDYLDECYWECADGDTRDIGWHNLEGGDVNDDGCVNILDIVQIIGDYGATVAEPCLVPNTECPPDDPAANAAPACDINGDCQVNILDLAQAAGSFGLCSNCP